MRAGQHPPLAANIVWLAEADSTNQVAARLVASWAEDENGHLGDTLAHPLGRGHTLGILGDVVVLSPKRAALAAGRRAVTDDDHALRKHEHAELWVTATGSRYQSAVFW